MSTILYDPLTKKAWLWVMEDIYDNGEKQRFNVINGAWSGTYHNGHYTYSRDAMILKPFIVNDRIKELAKEVKEHHRNTFNYFLYDEYNYIIGAFDELYDELIKDEK